MNPRGLRLSQCCLCVLWLSVPVCQWEQGTPAPNTSLHLSISFFQSVAVEEAMLQCLALLLGCIQHLHSFPKVSMPCSGRTQLSLSEEPPPVMCFTFPKQMSVQRFTESGFAKGCQHQNKTREKSLAFDFYLILMCLCEECALNCNLGTVLGSCFCLLLIWNFRRLSKLPVLVTIFRIFKKQTLRWEASLHISVICDSREERGGSFLPLPSPSRVG